MATAASDPLTIAAVFNRLPEHRGTILVLALLVPLLATLLAELFKGGGKRNLSLFAADCGLTVSFLAVCLEVMALAYYRWGVGGDPIRQVDIVLLGAPPFMLMATLGLLSFVHPLGSLATIKRMKALFMAVMLGGLLLFLLLRTRIWVVFYGNILFFILILAGLGYAVYWYFKNFLQPEE